MNHWLRLAAAVTGTVAMAAGCGDGAVGQSRGEPSTPRPGQSVTAAQIDSLVVPPDQVPGGLHVEGAPAQHPRSYPSDPDNSTCATDESSIFGDRPVAFRSVRYSGAGNLYVVQAIGVYADNAEADSAFQRFADELNACRSSGATTVVDSITRTAATWHQQGFSPVKGAEETSYAADARVVKNVVFNVGLGHFDDAQRTAATIAGTIAAKINDTT